MNKIAFIAAFLLLQIAPATGWAKEWVTKEKKIHHSFSMMPNDMLSVSNTYGNITINTWNKEELTVDIVVTIKARSEKKAEDMMNHLRMDVTDNSSKDDNIDIVSGIKSGCNIGNGNEMHINYVINMPKHNALKIIQKYGNVNLQDLSGNLNLILDYGNLNATSLSGTQNDLTLSFGNALIKQFSTGTITIRHGELKVEKIETVKMTNSFGKVQIGEVEEIKLSHSYGQLNIGTVGHIKGSINHSNIEIEQLKGNAKLSMSYSQSAKINSIGADANNIAISANYTNLSCHFTNGASLQSNMSLSYGSLKGNINSGNINIAQTSNDHNGSTYSGTIGTGKGTLSISARYSHILFN